MVDKFEAGNFYIDAQFGTLPFFVREVREEGKEIVVDFPPNMPELNRVTHTIRLDEIRQGYFHQFRLVSREEIKRITERLENQVNFYRSRTEMNI